MFAQTGARLIRLGARFHKLLFHKYSDAAAGNFARRSSEEEAVKGKKIHYGVWVAVGCFLIGKMADLFHSYHVFFLMDLALSCVSFALRMRLLSRHQNETE